MTTTERILRHNATALQMVQDALLAPTKEKQKMLFEIINPSDAVTCKADSLAIATFAVLLICPSYGVKSVDGDQKFFYFRGAVEAFTTEHGDAEKFLAEHDEAVCQCLESFVYGSPADRNTYETAMSLIDDANKREQFKAQWEDEKRSSMNKICQSAWTYAQHLREAFAAKAGAV